MRKGLKTTRRESERAAKRAGAAHRKAVVGTGQELADRQREKERQQAEEERQAARGGRTQRATREGMQPGRNW